MSSWSAPSLRRKANAVLGNVASAMKRLVDEAGEVGADVDRRVLLELREHLLAEQLDRAERALARVVAELHVADQLVDAEVGIVLHLVEALLRIADNDHVALVERVDRDVAVHERLQQRKGGVLL